MNERLFKTFIMICADTLIMAFSCIFGLIARFDFLFGQVPGDYFSNLRVMIPFHVVITVLIFYFAGLYSMDIHAIGFLDVIVISVTVMITNTATVILSLVTGHVLPLSVYFMILVSELILTVALRCSYRIYVSFGNILRTRPEKQENVMIVGGGRCCDMLLRELETSTKYNVSVKCIIDDNRSKIGSKIRGVKVCGNRFDIPKFVKLYNIDKIIFAIPSIDGKEKRNILEICEKTGTKVMAVPGVYGDLIDGRVSVSDLRDINIEDLLGRKQVILDDTEVNRFIKDKVVMVTGGGGSIGSEICRQVAERFPKKLIVLDIYENNAYDIQQELIRKYGKSLDLTVEIASVRDKNKTYELFEKHHPDIVFHAAAHKHVPLMEYCPSEAIKNNIFGTYHVVRASEKYGVSKFILISTDKAVNPTNIMGATKRFCEMIIQSRTDTNTEYATVRFGNVLGSNGSVVPLFTKQIKDGGPVTITDKRVIRYFMTISEASQLVLQAGAMAKKNQVFVLDMGEPVKILDLAEKMIRLSGKMPYKDIAIVETGLRPGEKLYEELLMKNENLEKTSHSDIYIEKQGEINKEKLMEGLKALDTMVSENAGYEEISAKLKNLVPTYKDPETINRRASDAIRDGSKVSLNEIATDCLGRLS